MGQSATASHPAPRAITDTASILLYSDNAKTRRAVRLAVGNAIGMRDVQIQWTEVATAEVAMGEAEASVFDLVICDNETAKLGGVGLIRQMRNELDWQPVALLIIARQQDAWLGAWSEADGAIMHPIDPFELRQMVAEMLGLEDR